MGTVTSRDGTTIGFDRIGSGPAVVIVDGAFCYRKFGVATPLAQILSSDFTVYTYDRRGRGESGDTPPYAVAREVEDLAAVIEEAGGSAYACGISSGAALALEAAASGLPITKLALYEPPFNVDPADVEQERAYTAQLNELLAAGRRGEAVELFFTSAGLSEDDIPAMRASPDWQVFEAVAPTLAYDHAILSDGLVPYERAARVKARTIVMNGAESPDFFHQAAKATADAIPGARHRALEGQSWGQVQPEVLAPALREFFRD